MTKKVRTYTRNDIQKVYERHHTYPNSVVYSTDGYNWNPVPVDTGKWNLQEWIYAFLELEP